jgi:hypothetical protein
MITVAKIVEACKWTILTNSEMGKIGGYWRRAYERRFAKPPAKTYEHPYYVYCYDKYEGFQGDFLEAVLSTYKELSAPQKFKWKSPAEQEAFSNRWLPIVNISQKSINKFTQDNLNKK